MARKGRVWKRPFRLSWCGQLKPKHHKAVISVQEMFYFASTVEIRRNEKWLCSDTDGRTFAWKWGCHFSPRECSGVLYPAASVILICTCWVGSSSHTLFSSSVMIYWDIMLPVFHRNIKYSCLDWMDPNALFKNIFLKNKQYIILFSAKWNTAASRSKQGTHLKLQQYCASQNKQLKMFKLGRWCRWSKNTAGNLLGRKRD